MAAEKDDDALNRDPVASIKPQIENGREVGIKALTHRMGLDQRIHAERAKLSFPGNVPPGILTRCPRSEFASGTGKSDDHKEHTGRVEEAS